MSSELIGDLTAAIALLMEQLEPKPASEKVLREKIAKLEAIDRAIERQIAHAQKKRGAR